MFPLSDACAPNTVGATHNKSGCSFPARRLHQ
jgi:hypothetical protein